MDIEDAINRKYTELNDNEKDILEYILNNKKECMDSTIIELAKVTHTSKSSILRLAKKIGFNGYSELKYSLKNDYSKPDTNNTENSFVNMQERDIQSTIKLFFQTDKNDLLKKIDSAKNIFCYGTGWGQRDVLNDFSRSMVPLNRYPILLSSETELKMAAQKGILEEDILIIVSLSGEIVDIKSELQILKMKNVSILSVTNISNNSLASLGTYNLYFQSTPKLFNNEPIYSFLPLHLIMDSLFRLYVDFKAHNEGDMYD